MKNKLTPDQLAMILADFTHGELNSCNGYSCENCTMSKMLKLDLKSKSMKVAELEMSICALVLQISESFNEVEND